VIPRVRVTRYVTPLREGGSLPGIVEADDLGTYVAKFRGAGQGVRVLVAEVIVGELVRRLGLRTPRLVGLQLDAGIARYEADEEVQDLINASTGLNLGTDFLPGSFALDRSFDVDPELAARVLWLDAFVANVDRSWRNPNMLVWHGDLWLIDHGASLYFHHAWPGRIGDPESFAGQPWSLDDHAFASYAGGVAAIDGSMAASVSDELIDDVLAEVPDEWLEPVPDADSPKALREAYARFLRARRDGGRPWLPGGAA